MLFNNAGLLFTGPFEDIPPEQNAAMIAVNLTALVNLTRAAFPWLRDTPDARVISMSSASSTYGVPELAVYSATKHAVRALTEALEIEWAPHGIRVCDVVPPYVDTPMISGARRVRSMETLGVELTPEQVAGTVWEAAHGEGLHWPVGRSYQVLHALQGVTPPALTRRLVKRFTGY